MKKISVWLRLIIKRLLKNPLFVLTLFLLPVMVLGIRFSVESGDSLLRVAVYAPPSGPESAEQRLLNHLLDTSGSAVTFYRTDSEEALQADVAGGTAACGYILPENLSEKLEQSGLKLQPLLRAIRQKDETRTKIIDELVYSGVYKFLSFHILSDFIHEKTKKEPSGELRELYNTYRDGQAFFEFEYADGSKNNILDRSNSNYMLLPVRGMVAVLLLLCGMTGTLFWYADRQKNIFAWLSAQERKRISVLFLTAPVLLSGVFGMLTIFLTGIPSGILNEILSMLLYLFVIIAFCDLLCHLLPRMEFMLAAIPVFAAGSLIVCPVFANLSSSLPVLSYIQKLTPVFYYLSAIYSDSRKLYMAAFGILLVVLRIIISSFRKPAF